MHLYHLTILVKYTKCAFDFGGNKVPYDAIQNNNKYLSNVVVLLLIMV